MSCQPTGAGGNAAAELPLSTGQRKPELSSALVGYADQVTAMGAGQRPRDGQAQAGSAVVTSTGSIQAN